MGDDLKKVKTGDPLRISARTFNTFVDTALDNRQRTQNVHRTDRRAFRQGGIIPVKNISGSDRGRFDVLGIDGVVFTPTDSPDAFKNQLALKGDTPSAATHTGKFVILLEPIRDSEIGMGCIDGICPVQVYVEDETLEMADVRDGDCSTLAASASGAGLILWCESGTGEVWAVVKLGVPGGAAVSGTGGFPAKIISADGTATYTMREQSLDGQGSFIDKPGTQNFSARNLAELSLGPGAAVDTGTISIVTTLLDTATPPNIHYVFDHPTYAKYLD